MARKTRRRDGEQNRSSKRIRAAIWVIAAILAATMCLPATVFAGSESELTDSVDPSTQEEVTIAEVPADPTAQEEVTIAAAPPTPVSYRNIFRIETVNGALCCFWYDANGVKNSVAQKKKCFVVKFDNGSTTSGTAYQKVGRTGKVYYFNAVGAGKPYTGWYTQDRKKYYFKSGNRLRGTKKIKKTWYKFSRKDGKLVLKIGDSVDKKIQRYSSARKYLIIVKLSERKVRIYKGKKNNWKRIHKYKCTIGTSYTPTIKGTFTIGTRGRYFNTGFRGRCWYYTQFCGNYLFHSIIYDRSSSPVHVLDGRLGIKASHGCIRLALKNARWIYRYIPSGTKVVIY